MNTSRDSFIRLEVRKQNWLRLEFFRRFLSHKFLFKRIILRALARDASLSVWRRISVSLAVSSLPRQSRTTRANTRCRVSGRAHQAFRNVQLARMEFRRAMREGSMVGLRLGRS
jgi:ribosomal protein S14